MLPYSLIAVEMIAVNGNNSIYNTQMECQGHRALEMAGRSEAVPIAS